MCEPPFVIILMMHAVTKDLKSSAATDAAGGVSTGSKDAAAKSAAKSVTVAGHSNVSGFRGASNVAAASVYDYPENSDEDLGAVHDWDFSVDIRELKLAPFAAADPKVVASSKALALAAATSGNRRMSYCEVGFRLSPATHLRILSAFRPRVSALVLVARSSRIRVALRLRASASVLVARSSRIRSAFRLRESASVFVARSSRIRSAFRFLSQSSVFVARSLRS